MSRRQRKANLRMTALIALGTIVLPVVGAMGILAIAH